ncbi:MAG: hypothetical protein JJE04_15890 [Acidobacteriia bacterium]|nr:hypothetical protein [Terriglobia bacterium]
MSQAFQVASANWGATSPVEMYKDKAPITDCRSGVCRPAYLWFNGYISPLVAGAARNGISGIPSGYKPYLAPINNTPGAPNFGNNNVSVPLRNGTHVTTAYSPEPEAPTRILKPSCTGLLTTRLTCRCIGFSRLRKESG